MALAHRNEIIIALIGLAGVIFTGVASNYDKLFGNDDEAVEPTSYPTSQDIDVQLRYFIEVSGFRKSLEEMEKVTAEKYKIRYDATATEIECVLDNRISKEQLIELFVTTMRNHMTLDQIKELNRVYSSDTMKSYNDASATIVRELMAGIDELYGRMIRRNQAIARAHKDKDKAGEACPSLPPNKAMESDT